MVGEDFGEVAGFGVVGPADADADADAGAADL
jgi:hypothetical protein